MSGDFVGSAPSLEEKTAAPRKPVDNVARQTFKQLRSRLWLTDSRPLVPPVAIHCVVMGDFETWARVGAGTGATTVYELERGE